MADPFHRTLLLTALAHGALVAGLELQELERAKPPPREAPSIRLVWTAPASRPAAPPVISPVTIATPARSRRLERREEVRPPRAVPVPSVPGPPAAAVAATASAPVPADDAAAGGEAAVSIGATNAFAADAAGAGEGEPGAGFSAPDPAAVYAATLQAHLERRRIYPAAARRRGLEGTVLVAVHLDPRGEIDAAEISGDCPHVLLCDAALDSIEEASPFPPPPPELGADLKLHIPIRYRLRES